MLNDAERDLRRFAPTCNDMHYLSVCCIWRSPSRFVIVFQTDERRRQSLGRYACHSYISKLLDAVGRELPATSMLHVHKHARRTSFVSTWSRGPATEEHSILCRCCSETGSFGHGMADMWGEQEARARGFCPVRAIGPLPAQGTARENLGRRPASGQRCRVRDSN